MMRFRSNGKLLITGEYLVLSGARALAIPLRSGQSMTIEENGLPKKLEWTVSDIRGKWFDVLLSLPELEILDTSDDEKARFLQKALKQTQALQPDFLQSEQGLWVDNFLEFERDWGMGSSSTFIANLAQWARVDAFELHHRITMGSGYDIACALSDKPILFTKSFETRTIDKINWSPLCRKHLAFVYLGKKQSTASSMEQYKNLDFKDTDLKKITAISDEIWLLNNEVDLMSRIWDHEELMSRLLKQTPVQDRLFKDFNGAIKSLGAWGGDFILAVGQKKFKIIQEYFISKGFPTIFSWDDLIIEN